METYDLNKWFLATRDMVMFQKADDECHLLNSMVIIDDKFDFEKDFKAAKDTNDYFFSRDDSKIVYPALVISINADTLSDYGSGIFQRYCHTIEIGVVDQEIKDCVNCTPCSQRKKEQILVDVGKMLRQTVNAIVNYSLWSVVESGTPKFVYAYGSVIDVKLAKGIYSSATRVVKESEIIKKIFREKNDQKQFVDMEYPKMLLHGKFTVITVCDLCSQEDMEFSYKKYKSVVKC